jgi:hypothetical protein
MVTLLSVYCKFLSSVSPSVNADPHQELVLDLSPANAMLSVGLWRLPLCVEGVIEDVMFPYSLL